MAFTYIKLGIRIPVLPRDLNTMAKDIQFDYWVDIDRSTARFNCLNFKVLRRPDPSLGQTASGLFLDSLRQLSYHDIGVDFEVVTKSGSSTLFTSW